MPSIADLEREFYLKNLYPNPDPDPGSAYFPTFSVGELITSAAGIEDVNLQYFIESDDPTNYFVLLSDLEDGTTYRANAQDLTTLNFYGIVRITENDGSMFPDAFPPGSYAVGYADAGTSFAVSGTSVFDESAFTDQMVGFDGTGISFEMVGYGLMWSIGSTELPFTLTEEV